MSGAGLQDAIVALAALAAGGWLLGRWWRRRRRPAGCDCEGCPVAEGARLPRVAGGVGASGAGSARSGFVPASELLRRR
jgi:hypothetical protein